MIFTRTLTVLELTFARLPRPYACGDSKEPCRGPAAAPIIPGLASAVTLLRC
jgi:hypothetical protein